MYNSLLAINLGEQIMWEPGDGKAYSKLVYKYALPTLPPNVIRRIRVTPYLTPSQTSWEEQILSERLFANTAPPLHRSMWEIVHF